jgi:hypothetical protein
VNRFPVIPGSNPNPKLDKELAGVFGQDSRENSIFNTLFKKDEEIPTFDSFYFRLQKAKMYYTETKNDSVVRGSISFI